MLAAWSILNKVNDRGDSRFSDLVLVVCPNVTIRTRLGELDPREGDASLYRTRDLVPAHLHPKPEAVVKWAATPVAMLAGLWEELRAEWAQRQDDPRPPVFIIVCRNTAIAKVVSMVKRVADVDAALTRAARESS